MKSFTGNFATMESYSAEIWGIETGLSLVKCSSQLDYFNDQVPLLNQKF